MAYRLRLRGLSRHTKRVLGRMLVRRLPRVASMVDMETARFRDAVLRLPIADRDVFLLSRFGGQTYEQIAETSGRPVGDVERLMARALVLLSKSLVGEPRR